MFIGEIISLGVAVSWTATALFAEVASKRIGSLPLNVIRMGLSLFLLGATLWVATGVPYPVCADGSVWFWLGLSGFVGYVLGDYCLFQSYILIGSRFGQLFMTLSAPTAAIFALLLLDEKMSLLSIVGMLVTVFGIGLSVMSKEEGTGGRKRKMHLKLPLKGVVFAILAGMGQGAGLVLSKVGMRAYESSLAANGVSLGMMMPFASTMIRAVVGMAGFSIALFFFTHNGRRKLVEGVCSGKTMLYAFCASVFGPFIGVSLSLMATLYTSTGIAQTIMALTPVFILAPSYVLFGQKVSFKEVVGAVISVVGVCLFFV